MSGKSPILLSFVSNFKWPKVRGIKMRTMWMLRSRNDLHTVTETEN